VGASQIDATTLHENSDLLITFLPYIKEYWWVFALAAGGFIAYSTYARIKDRIEGRS